MSTKTDFLRALKPHAFTVYKTIGILPSITAAQAALESAWGKSGLATRAHNYFGIKGGPGVVSMDFMTREYINGRMVSVSQPFQKFTSLQDCIINGYMKRVIGGDRYRRARGVKDPRTAITIIWQAGYATDPNYVNLIMSTINSNNLTEWDREAFAGGDGGNWDTDFSEIQLEGEQFYTFNNSYIKKNNYTRPGLKLAGVAAIVLHDAGTPGLTANTIRSNLDKGNGGRKNGYHILIDKKDTVGIVPLDEVVYHTDSSKLEIDFLKKSTNYYPNGGADLTTLSIGLCSESDGTFSNNTMARAIAVCAELINHYSLPMETVLRAFEVDKSPEPLPFISNYFDYTTFISLVEYQRNQDTPLMNEDLQSLYEDRANSGSTGSTTGQLIGAVSGTRKKLLELAFQMEGWGMSYSQARRYQIYRNGYADCSSFTQYLYKQVAGIDPGITTKFQIQSGKQVSKSQVRPGDLVFWCPRGRNPSIPGNVSHMGMVIDEAGDYCIHTSYSAGPGRTVQRLAIANMGLTLMQYRSYISETGEVPKGSEVGAPIGNTGDLDITKQYVIDVKSSINSYNGDSNNATSIKRLAKGSVVKVLSIGANGYRIGQGEWVLKKDSGSYDMRSTGSRSAPVGSAVVLGTAPVKAAPSIASANVLEQGKAKLYSTNTMLEVYGKRNAMLLVSLPGTQEMYIPEASVAYISSLNSYPLYTDIEQPEGTPQSVSVPVTVRARQITETFDKNTGLLIAPGSISVNPSKFPVGSNLNIVVPSMPKYNGIYNVSATHNEEENIVYIYTDSPTDVVIFGNRTGSAVVVSK